MRAFLNHRNAVMTAVKRVDGLSCTTESEKKEVLHADLKQNLRLCLHTSFYRNRQQTGAQEHPSVKSEMGASEMGAQEQEAME